MNKLNNEQASKIANGDLVVWKVGHRLPFVFF